MRPIRERNRIETLDILRGFALFGVVVVNMSVDTSWSRPVVADTPSNVDDVLDTLLRLFGAGKFLTIFTFMFGMGLVMQVDRCHQAGRPWALLLSRRLAVLLVIGLIHYLLIGWTDILHVYAVLGFLLLVLQHFSSRVLLASAVALALLNIGEPRPLVLQAWEVVTAGTDSGVVANAETAAEIAQNDEGAGLPTPSVEIYANGSWAEILGENLRDFSAYMRGFAIRWWLGSLFPVMLLGAWAARKRIFDEIDTHLRLLRGVFVWSLALGLPAAVLDSLLLQAESDASRPFWLLQCSSGVEVIGVRGLGFAYASGTVLLLRDARVRERLSPLAAAGRMALSNYLLQTVVAVALFYGVGLGFYGRLNPLHGAAVAVLTFALQMYFSAWWVKRYRFGPAEWLWRSLTYGQLQPMKK